MEQIIHKTNSLTFEDIALMQSLINEIEFSRRNRDINGRLLQSRSDIKHFTQAIRNALINGEPEDSDFISRLTDKLAVAINKEAELSALVPTQNQVA